MKAELCPVCKGLGTFTRLDNSEKTCHGCGGKGWVEVHEEIKNTVNPKLDTGRGTWVRTPAGNLIEVE
jgi:DnaJ-class molecular chaperone